MYPTDLKVLANRSFNEATNQSSFMRFHSVLDVWLGVVHIDVSDGRSRFAEHRAQYFFARVGRGKPHYEDGRDSGKGESNDLSGGDRRSHTDRAVALAIPPRDGRGPPLRPSHVDPVEGRPVLPGVDPQLVLALFEDPRGKVVAAVSCVGSVRLAGDVPWLAVEIHDIARLLAGKQVPLRGLDNGHRPTTDAALGAKVPGTFAVDEAIRRTCRVGGPFGKARTVVCDLEQN